MALEDEDFIIRQTKLLAKGLGQFLGKESVDEILQQDAEQADKKDKNKKKEHKLDDSDGKKK